MGQVSLSLIFLHFISATSSQEVNGISTYNNIRHFKYIQSYNCPSFKKIISLTVSRVMTCFVLCGQILNCYAVSYTNITSTCELFTNQAFSDTTFTYFVNVEWEWQPYLSLSNKNENKITKFIFAFLSWQTFY